MAGAPTGINPAAAAGLSQPTGLEALLAHPYFQAAAAGLFGALASPRSRGLSGALGLGGLGALNAFQQAEKQKLTLPLLASQIQGQQAQTQSNLATSAWRKAQTANLQGQPQGNEESAKQMELLAADPTQPASVRKAYGLLAPSVRSGKVSAADAYEKAQSGDLKGAQQLLAQANTALAKERLKLAPELAATRETADIARAGESGASAALSHAKMGEVAPTIEHLKAETAAVGKTKPKAVSAVEIDKAAETEAQNEAKNYWWASGAKRDEYIKLKKAEAVARLTATVGGASAAGSTGGDAGPDLSHLGHGWKWKGKPPPDGPAVAIGPDGVEHPMEMRMR